MLNPSLFLYILVPVICAATLWYFLRAKQQALIAGISSCAAGVLFLVLCFAISNGTATADVEILNGKIVSKNREHGTYEESYSCNCRKVTSCSGSGKNRTCFTSEVCDTCYRTHYTVDWKCNSTVGQFKIDSADSTSSLVYATPNPQRWSIINIGDPASRRHLYTNYVQAVPESLFKPSSEALKQRFLNKIPKYPDEIFDFYMNNHFLSAGYKVQDEALWNADLANMLRDLGPQKQVNAIVLIAKTADPDYEFALRDAWDGANKNDVIVLIGSESYPKINFVRILSWTKNELFKVELRDRIQELGNISREQVISILSTQIQKNFGRRHMADFKYLESEIDPPLWLIALTLSLIICGNIITYLALIGFFNSKRKFRF